MGGTMKSNKDVRSPSSGIQARWNKEGNYNLTGKAGDVTKEVGGVLQVGEGDEAGAGESASRQKKIKLAKTTESASFNHLENENNAYGASGMQLQQQRSYQPRRVHFVKYYFCQLCQYKNPSRKDVVAHMMIHVGNEVECEFCGQICNQRIDLVEHMDKHVGLRPFSCTVCGASYLLIQDLVAHRVTHGDERAAALMPFSCSKCNYRCRHASVLEEHYKTRHSRHACRYCEFRCSNPQDLTKHQMLHPGGVELDNDVRCGASYPLIQDLVVHKVTHGDERAAAQMPFSCSQCNYRCRRSSMLEEHYKTRHSQHMCTCCDFRCSNPQDLTHHQQLHTGRVKLDNDVIVKEQDISEEGDVVVCNGEDVSSVQASKPRQEMIISDDSVTARLGKVGDVKFAHDVTVKDEDVSEEEDLWVGGDSVPRVQGSALRRGTSSLEEYDKGEGVLCIVKDDDESTVQVSVPKQETVDLEVVDDVCEEDGGVLWVGKDDNVYGVQVSELGQETADWEKSETINQVKPNQSNQQQLCSYRPDECHKNKLHFCNICQYKNPSRIGVVAHMTIHVGNEKACDFCHRQFDLPGAMKDHLNEHIGHRPYACDICHEGFYILQDLMKHETYAPHHVEKPLSCDTCRYKFRHPALLEEHNKIHSSYPYSCDTCSFRSMKASALAKHTRIHTGKKLYACNVCDFRSSDFRVLSQHKMDAQHKTAEKPFKCGKCDYRSTRKGAMKQHIMSKHCGEKYACRLCHREFSRPWNRNAHELKVHGRKA